MSCLSLTTPGTEACDAVGGALGRSGGGGQGGIIGRVSSERVPLRMPPSAHLHYFRVARDTTRVNFHFEFGSTLYLMIASNAGSILWL
jgi:hypothetical protein